MIRPGTLDDIDQVHALMSATYAGFVISLEGRRYALKRHIEREGTAWFAAEDGGRLVGWASTGRELDTSEPDVWWLNVVVDESVRGRGLGSDLYERAVAHTVGLGAVKIITSATTGDAVDRFAADRGWEHTHTERISAIDPRTTDHPSPPDDVTLVPFTAFADDPRPLYDVDMAVSLDVPSDVPFDNVPYEEWHARWWQHPDIDHDVSTAALVDGQPVAISMMRVDRATGRAGNDITGTLRAHRRRGLATLVKLESLMRAAGAGITIVVTGNDATNAAMLAVNDRLGYRPFTEHRTFVKRIA